MKKKLSILSVGVIIVFISACPIAEEPHPIEFFVKEAYVSYAGQDQIWDTADDYTNEQWVYTYTESSQIAWAEILVISTPSGAVLGSAGRHTYFYNESGQISRIEYRITDIPNTNHYYFYESDGKIELIEIHQNTSGDNTPPNFQLKARKYPSYTGDLIGQWEIRDFTNTPTNDAVLYYDSKNRLIRKDYHWFLDSQGQPQNVRYRFSYHYYLPGETLRRES